MVISLVTLFLSAPTVGMNRHLPSPADSVAMKAAGVEHVRMDFNWFQFEPQQGQFDWSAIDSSVNGARAQGLNVFATVAYTPQWASSVPSCTQSSANEAMSCD